MDAREQIWGLRNNRQIILIHEILQRLKIDGAPSFPILSTKIRETLLQEAISYSYQDREKIVAPSGVIQDISAYDQLPTNSLFRILAESFQIILESSFKFLPTYPFTTPLIFNESVLQRYRTRSEGITPHRDNIHCINLICIFIIAGRGRFYVCDGRDERQPINPRPIVTNPGDVILMRGPGFMGMDKNCRPMHGICNITSERYTFGLRQDTRKNNPVII